MLEARNLRKVYVTGGRTIEAVADVSLEVKPGEFVALCGRSGSGKSTLMGILAGMCRPTTGAVALDGVDVWSLGTRELARFRGRSVGFLFQFASLLPALRAIDNVALPALVAGEIPLPLAYERAASLLEQVGLAKRGEAYPNELSGGEQRRVALARALINDPPVLLADEPTSDLDEQTESEILQLLLAIRLSRGKTLVVVTHDPDVARLADRVLRVAGGRIEQVEPGQPRPRPEPVSVPFPSPPPVATPEPLGGGLGRFAIDCVTWLVIVVLAVTGLNHGLARLQRSRLQEQKSVREQLESAAMQQLRADVEDITKDADKTYRVTIYLENRAPQEDLHVLAPTVRAFVQVDRGWEEVPLEPADGQAGRLVALTGRHRFAFRFRIGQTRFEELLPGYAHVRFSATMLVSRSREPGHGLFERTDDYYVYLKPHDADDAAILKKMKFPGKPPLWIPMPSH